MNAILVASDLNMLLTNKLKLEGNIHSVFEHAVNILTNDNFFITILTIERDISPMSIIIKENNFLAIDFKVGQEVLITKKKIQIINSEFEIILTNSKEWNFNIFSKSKYISLKNYKKNIQLFEKTLIKYGNSNGILPIVFEVDAINIKSKLNKPFIASNHYSVFIKERVNEFLKQFINFDENIFPLLIKKIIGFGPGLTPSIDDFLSGLMIMSIHLARYFELDTTKIKRINRLIYTSSLEKTTKVSEEMLKNSMNEKSSLGFLNVIKSILYESNLDTEKTILEAIKYGDTSGSDFLLGVLTAINLFENENIRRNFIND
ncbi:oxamate carbamoyltransferase subunit AllH family protein [Helicovermis profundi]|uniref:DUF2877 domain-containing protein n=1 Tax=Helicovermis profundi TaxID=3065157 RepID=A0AAU9E2Y3_9FIRM|nr:hypothetical protein HLPR_11720 [Clostridia bacterium S502]